jgi:hypothetical protein
LAASSALAAWTLRTANAEASNRAGIKRRSIGHFLTIFSASTAPVPSAGFGAIMREKKERRKVMCAPSAEEADRQVES